MTRRQTSNRHLRRRRRGSKVRLGERARSPTRSRLERSVRLGLPRSKVSRLPRVGPRRPLHPQARAGLNHFEEHHTHTHTHVSPLSAYNAIRTDPPSMSHRLHWPSRPSASQSYRGGRLMRRRARRTCATPEESSIEEGRPENIGQRQRHHQVSAEQLYNCCQCRAT